jgi:hypothetical protein
MVWRERLHMRFVRSAPDEMRTATFSWGLVLRLRLLLRRLAWPESKRQIRDRCEPAVECVDGPQALTYSDSEALRLVKVLVYVKVNKTHLAFNALACLITYSLVSTSKPCPECGGPTPRDASSDLPFASFLNLPA